MKSILRLGAIAIVLLIIICALSGCELSERRKVVKFLEEKYGEKFEVCSVARGYEAKFSTLVCYPKNGRETIFSVQCYDDGRIYDQYRNAKFGKIIERELCSYISATGISPICKLRMFADDTTNYSGDSLDEYLKNVKLESLYIKLSIKSSDIKSRSDAENIIKALDKLKHKYNNVDVYGAVYFIKDEDYNSVKDYYNNHTYTDNSFDRYYYNSDNTKRMVYIKGEAFNVDNIMSNSKIY